MKKFKRLIMDSIDLYLVGSPWHAIIAASMIKDNNRRAIVNVEAINPNTRKSIERVLDNLKVEYIINGDHEKTRYNSIKKIGLATFFRYQKEEFSNINAKCSELLLNYQIKNIYIFNLNSPISRFIIKKIDQKEKVIKVEDGINDYLSISFINYPFLQKILKKVLSRLTGYDDIYREASTAKEKLSDDCLLFFPNKSSAFKGCSSLLGYKESIHKQLAILGSGIEESQKSILVLGQTLFEDGHLSLADEMSIYYSSIEYYTRLGYNIEIKLHPRSCNEKVESIKNFIAETAYNFKLYSGADILAEAIMIARKYDYVIGMWSNPIIYGKNLLNITTGTLMYEVFEKFPTLQSKSIYKVHNELVDTFGENYIDYRLT